MAFTNLRWLCAPLLFVSSVVFGDEAYIPPPIPYTEVYLPASEFDNNLKACRSGIEFTWGTPEGSPSDCTLDEHGFRCLAVTTGKWCGDLSENNEFLTNPPPAIGFTDAQLVRIDDLFDAMKADMDEAMNWRNRAFHAAFGSPEYQVAVSNTSLMLHNALIDFRALSELTTSSLSDLRDYANKVEGYYQSIDTVNDAVVNTNLKFNGAIASLKSQIQDISEYEPVIENLVAELARIEADLNGLNFDDIQDILDSIESLDGDFSSLLDGIRGAYREISSLRVEMYGQISDLRTEFNSSKQATNDELAVIREDIRDTEMRVYDSVFPAIGEVYGHIGSEIAALTDSIDSSNADIASSIDSQTGEIVGAIDGQSSIISDGFSDLTDFLGDGEPSVGDLANQDSELSGLVSDYDYFVDYNIDIGEAVCPAPYQLDLSITGKTVYVSFEPICEASLLVKPLLIAASSVAFALIVMGVRRA